MVMTWSLLVFIMIKSYRWFARLPSDGVLDRSCPRHAPLHLRDEALLDGHHHVGDPRVEGPVTQPRWYKSLPLFLWRAFAAKMGREASF